MNIILIGFKNSGKTTIGKRLSQILNKNFVDTDDLIIEKYKEIDDNKLSISKIYQNLGKFEFRKIESEVVNRLKLFHNSIIATGGGTVLDPNNLILLKSIGHIFFLDISYEKAIERIYNNKVSENLFLGKKKDKKNIVNILKSRLSIYRSVADFIITVDNLNEKIVTNQIIKLWQATV